MSWKLTIDVIFNSFPLIKNKNLIPFLCHCERSVEIHWLQSRHCERSVAIQRLQTVIANKVKQSSDFKPLIASKAKQSNDFKRFIASKALEVFRGLWTKKCWNSKKLGVYDLFCARIVGFWG